MYKLVLCVNDLLYQCNRDFHFKKNTFHGVEIFCIRVFKLLYGFFFSKLFFFYIYSCFLSMTFCYLSNSKEIKIIYPTVSKLKILYIFNKTLIFLKNEVKPIRLNILFNPQIMIALDYTSALEYALELTFTIPFDYNTFGFIY